MHKIQLLYNDSRRAKRVETETETETGTGTESLWARLCMRRMEHMLSFAQPFYEGRAGVVGQAMAETEAIIISDSSENENEA